MVERIGEYGGTWRSGLRGGGDTLWLVRTMGYENLVRWNPEWTEVIPNVAESFEVNDDATAFTFRLRQGMRWNDGAPFTADDIMFWFEDVFSNPELTPAPPSWLTSGDSAVVVEKIDDHTVVFRFEQPSGLFLQLLATPDAAPLTLYPRHYAEPFHPDYNPDVAGLVQEAGFSDWTALFNSKVGNGAQWANREMPTLYGWRLTTAYGEGTATQVVAERNPYYFKVDPEGNQLPYIDRLVYTVGEDVEVLVLQALAGEIDMQDRHIATLSNRAVFFDGMTSGDYHFFETVPSSMNNTILALNLTHRDPVKREMFQNKDFRIGLSHAIDRQEIIDLIYVGQGEPWQAAPRPESPLYSERLAKQYTEYDVGLANEHLDRAGYTARDAQGFRLGPDGRRLSFVVEVVAIQQSSIDTLELIKDHFAEVGVEMQIRALDRTLYNTRRLANQYDAMVWGGDGGLDVMLDGTWYFPFSVGSSFAQAWQSWYNNRAGVAAPTEPETPPEAVQRQLALYDQLKASNDPAQQTALMAEILDVAADQFYAIGTSLPAPGYGIVKNSFHNVPEVMPNAWFYPHPAPTNPEQYFISNSSDSTR